MFRFRAHAVALALLASAGSLGAQTVTWGGGFPNGKFSVATNWYGSSVPANNGTAIVELTGNSDSELKLDEGVSLLGLEVVVSGYNGETAYIQGTDTLSLGEGGLVLTSDGTANASLSVQVPVVLASNQVWSQTNNSNGYLNVSGSISGPYGLTLSGDSNFEVFRLTSPSSTFSGGVTVTSTNTSGFVEGSQYQTTVLAVGSNSAGPAGSPTSGPVGTGILTLGDGTTLTTTGAGPVTLGNTLSLGDNSTQLPITFGGPALAYQPAQLGGTVLTLTGPATLNEEDIELDMAGNSAVTFAGALNGYNSAVCLDFGSAGSSNTVAILQGTVTNVNRLDLEDSVSVILDGTGPSQIAAVGDIGFEGDAPNAYLGVGRGYSTAGNFTAFLSYMHSTGSDANFQGTLGFDTTSGATATFNDPVDLTYFTNSQFLGLGSATSAVLGTGAVITPPNGNDASGTAYLFGGGGGTLTVQSALTDGNPLYNPDDGDYDLPNSRALSLNAGNGPLTLILSGPLSYSGGTQINGGALIFDTPLPASGMVVLNSGYVGSTVNSGYSDGNANIQSFINLFSLNPNQAVIGFDAIDGSTRQVTSDIDMSVTGLGIYLGTATAVNYSGNITPYGGVYQFAGVKGGQVTVSSTLTGESSVNIGLPSQLYEGFNIATGSQTQSSVTLSGSNTYLGTTTLQSGILYVTNSSSIGSGDLIVPDSVGYTQWGQELAASGGPVTLANNLQVPSTGLALNTGSSEALTLAGVISDYLGDDYGGLLGIFGTVTLSGNNTYSGGTQISGANVVVASDTGLGTGDVQATGSILNFTSASPSVNGLSLSSSTATFSGSPYLSYVQMSNASVLNFNGATAQIYGLNDDTSGNAINLASGTELEVYGATEDGGNGSTYHGTINGGGSLFVTGGGNLDLRGANTFTGGTTIDTSTFLIASNSSALGTGGVTVNGALVTNIGVTITNPITLETSGALAGFGTFSPGGVLTFGGGSTVDPGRGSLSTGSGGSQVPIAGTLSIGSNTSVVFGSGGIFYLSMTDAAGVAGSGYGTLNVGGSLSFDVPGAPFNIVLASYDASTLTLGNAANFDPTQAYSWTLVTAAGGITGFNPGYFNVYTTFFSNPTGIGSFNVSESGDELLLNFTPVPEPSTWVMLAGGLASLGAAARRRRR